MKNYKETVITTWKTNLDDVLYFFNSSFASSDTPVVILDDNTKTFFPPGRSPMSDRVAPKVRIIRTTHITSDPYPESHLLRHNQTRVVVAEHLLDFTDLSSEDLIRLGEDLLHAFSLFSRIPWHSIDKGDYALISSISDILVVSRDGEVPMSLPSKEAAALAETFRMVRPPH